MLTTLSKRICSHQNVNRSTTVLVFRCYPTTSKKKWREPVEKLPILDPGLFKAGEAVSGSANKNVDWAEFYSKPFELQISELTKNGYLRFQKAYEPPKDVKSRLLSILTHVNPKFRGQKLEEVSSYKLSDVKFKYDLLTKTFKEFQHSVPNSMLHLMETTGDVIQFYTTPVETTNPYENLCRTNDLPPNLHIQKEPVRFNPETDTMFGGISAFPKTTTIVTGLRAKQKYKGHVSKILWPHV